MKTHGKVQSDFVEECTTQHTPAATWYHVLGSVHRLLCIRNALLN